MKNKFSLLVAVIFFSFCFVIFYKGLNTTNTYTPKIDEKKIIPTFKAKDFNSNNYVNSDKIFVLDQGQIIDQGNHDDLIKKSIIYKNFYEKQLRKD